MSKTIGILGGMGPLATADLFRKITCLTKADCDNDHIRVYIDSNARIPDRTAAILSGGTNPVPEMTSALRHLEACGADCIIMPCNTAHYFLPQLQAKTEIPFLSMLAATAKACATKFPGKTVIFPNCPDMPLTAVDKMPMLVPGLEKTFAADGTYTTATEAELLRKFEK